MATIDLNVKVKENLKIFIKANGLKTYSDAVALLLRENELLRGKNER